MPGREGKRNSSAGHQAEIRVADVKNKDFPLLQALAGYTNVGY